MKVKLIIKLYKILKKDNIELNASLKDYSSFKIGGNAQFLLYPTSIKMAIKLFRFLNKFKLSFIVLGNATNILFTKDVFIAVSMKKLNKIKVNKNFVYCESGLSLFKFNDVLRDNNLCGYERLYGIPGSIGGGIIQNCGAYGTEIFDNLISVTYFDGKHIKTIKKEKIKYGYRFSEFKNKKNYVVLSAKFCLKFKNKEEIEKMQNEVLTLRKSKQPYEYPSAGSVFKRIDGVYISKVIDDLGLKGYSIGGAKISEKHAGFIINYNNATSEDVINLINFIKNKVKFEKNIDLECEIVII